MNEKTTIRQLFAKFYDLSSNGRGVAITFFGTSNLRFGE